MNKLFESLKRLRFKKRINRFTLIASDDRGDPFKVYLPNSGSLEELLLPGRELLVIDNPRGSLPFRAVGVIDGSGNTIMIDSLKVNDLLPLIMERIPSLRGYKVIKREFTYGGSRFDFLLERGSRRLLLEVKGCTLFWRDIASFPDAPTRRGTKHIKTLARLPEGIDGGVLFLIQRPVKYFIPNVHTDPEFAREIYLAKERLLIQAISLRWDEKLNLIEDSVSEAKILWKEMEPLLQDKGAYVLILFNERQRSLNYSEGIKQKSFDFPKGFYAYVGSGLRSLSSRIKRHLSTKTKPFWHIDHIKEKMKIVKVIPIRSVNRIECDIAREVKKVADNLIPGFGSSDCRCESHLFYFKEDPNFKEDFLEIILNFRFGVIK